MKRLPLIALPLLAACSSVPDIKFPDVTTLVTPYRIDVRQGNFVTQEMVAQLKPGQTKDQVRFALGTPLVSDIFHADRWDYVYRLRAGRDDEVQQRRLVVFFEDGKLVRVGGDVLAGDPAPTAEESKQKPRVIEIKAAAGAAAKEEKKAEAKPEADAPAASK